MAKRTTGLKPPKKETPKPRLVSESPRLERDENQSAFSAVQRIIDRTEATRKAD